MDSTSQPDCPLRSTAVTDPEELRVHLMVDHRKSAVVAGYVDRLDRPPAMTP